MIEPPIAPLRFRVDIERWPLAVPLRITGHEFTLIDVIVVMLESEGHVGRGEAVGVYYRGESAASMIRQLEAVRPSLEAGTSRSTLQRLLPAGGARNAVDCALWDLHAQVIGRNVSQLIGVTQVRPLLTMFTCSADSPENMAAVARGYAHARTVKLKLTGEAVDAERVRAVREARADVAITVDANQGYTREALLRLMPTLEEARVSLIEQPFPIGNVHWLDNLRSRIPIAADESVQSANDIPDLVGRFQVVNIKLDKCGGLTEAIAMAKVARKCGLKTWVGNMIGTSLAMAPAYIAGQLCDFVELDGPVFLEADRDTPVQYSDGFVICPEQLWGTPRAGAST